MEKTKDIQIIFEEKHGRWEMWIQHTIKLVFLKKKKTQKNGTRKNI